MEEDLNALLVHIGRALGSSEPYGQAPETSASGISVGTGHMLKDATGNASNEVLGGAVDPNDERRVAWIEEVIEAHGGGGGYVPVEIYLRVASGGEMILERPIESYNPYFGCTVWAMEWRGDTVVTVYREKHRMLAWSVPVDGTDLRLAVVNRDREPRISGDLLIAGSRYPGVLELRRVPTLEPLPPVTDGDEIVVRAWPENVEAAIDEIKQAAFRDDLVEPAADLLVTTQTSAFWQKPAEPGPAYDRAERSETHSFSWLPVYWYEYLRDTNVSRGEEFLALLDTIAGRTGVEQPAARHLVNRARALGEICRTGRLPEGEYCFLWYHARPLPTWVPPFTANAYKTLAEAGLTSLSDREDE